MSFENFFERKLLWRFSYVLKIVGNIGKDSIKVCLIDKQNRWDPTMTPTWSRADYVTNHDRAFCYWHDRDLILNRISRTKFSIVIGSIVSITKFSIMIGSPCAYSSRNRRTIKGVSNYRYPIWRFCNLTPVIRYPRDSYVNFACFLWCFLQFSKLLKRVTYVFFAQKKFSKDIFYSEIWYRYD